MSSSLRTGGTGKLPPAAKLVALLAFAVSWLALLAARPLFNPDEGRYAEIPREMLVSGDWVVPRLNALVYIEKPPLQYWATAAAFEVFGISDWAARLYTGLCGLLTVVLTGWLGARLWGRRAGWNAAIMLASSLLLFVMSHQLTLDMSLTFFTTLTLGAFCLAQQPRPEPRARRSWMWVAWISAAAAFLTKGLLALVLPGLALALYSFLFRQWRPWRKLSIASGLPLFLLLAAPWCLQMQRRVPEFFDFFFVREHFQRFLTLIEERYQPWWFFIPVLALGSLPWIVPAARALGSGWRACATAGQFDARRFLWVWSLVIFVFFSASDSKLIPYILPMLPTLALLMGSAAPQALRRDLRSTSVLQIALGVLLIGTAALLPRLLQDPLHRPFFLELRIPLLAMGLIMAGGGVLALRVREPLAAIGVTAYLAVALLMWAARAVGPLYSGATLAAQLSGAVTAATPIYSVRTYDQSLTFYLGHTMTLVDSRGELDFGLRLAPHKTIASLDDFQARWRAEPQALAVMEPDTYAKLREAALPMVLRATAPKRLVVSRR